LLRLNARFGRPTDIEGSWYGNDTCWRMVLDLHRIVRFGTVGGTLARTPQREVLTIMDALVAGQGEGPLHPAPLPLGVVLAGFHAPTLDWVGASLLGMDPSRIPLIRHAISSSASADAAGPLQSGFALKAAALPVGQLEALISCHRLAARVPDGWIGYDRTE
jgi:hypothetical protein